MAGWAWLDAPKLGCQSQDWANMVGTKILTPDGTSNSSFWGDAGNYSRIDVPQSKNSLWNLQTIDREWFGAKISISIFWIILGILAFCVNLWVSILVVLGFAREIVPPVTTLAFHDGFLGSTLGMNPPNTAVRCSVGWSTMRIYEVIWMITSDGVIIQVANVIETLEPHPLHTVQGTPKPERRCR